MGRFNKRGNIDADNGMMERRELDDTDAKGRKIELVYVVGKDIGQREPRERSVVLGGGSEEV